MQATATFKDAFHLAQRFQKGDSFRRHVLNRLPLVIPVVALCLAISIACAAATVVAFASVRTWLALPALLLSPAVLLGSLLLQLYVFFSWIEERAIAQVVGRKPGRIGLPAIPLALALGLLGVPLALLAAVAPALAAVLVVLAVATPFAYASLDR